MVVTVHSQHYDLTGPVKRFAIENLADPLEQIWRKEGSALEIYLRDLRGTKGGLDMECRVIFYIPNGPKLVITEVTEDMRKSIHQARKRLMRRARAYIGDKIYGARKPRKYFIAKLQNTELVDGRFRRSAVVGAEEYGT
jgi:hypothetical protein